MELGEDVGRDTVIPGYAQAHSRYGESSHPDLWEAHSCQDMRGNTPHNVRGSIFTPGCEERHVGRLSHIRMLGETYSHQDVRGEY